MEAILLNPDLESIGVIDSYKSFIWTDRYDEHGDFEIYVPISEALPNDIRKGCYLWNENSEHMMIVESIRIESDIEDGAYFLVTGRSLESLLKRRIVWNKRVFSIDDEGNEPNLQNGIKELFEENIINPEIEIRKIPNFIFEESTDEKITSLTFEGEYLGDELYDVVSKLCKEKEIGFKVTLNESKQFVFKLYAGVDRSYEQTANPYVIFSPDYDNILNTNYIDSDEKLKNVTLVVGESEYNDKGEEITRVQWVEGFSSGIERREIFTDATSFSTDDGYGGILSAEQYQAHLRQKGIDTLMENTSVTAFDGEVDPSRMYVYGVDYFIGDIVQIANEYGQEGRAYISEFIMSCDVNGTSMYPTFQTIQKGVYET